MPRNALGRGLGALIREPEAQSVPASQGSPTGAAVAAPARDTAIAAPFLVDIDLIDPSPYQPRTRFREEALEELADRGRDGIEAACAGSAQKVLQLGEDLLDGIEVGRVFRQEEELGAGGADGVANGSPLVAAEIVHHDDVA